MSWREGRTKVLAHFYRSFRLSATSGAGILNASPVPGLSPIALYSCSRNTCRRSCRRDKSAHVHRVPERS